MGLCPFWSKPKSSRSSEHVTLALSESSIWELGDTTGQQELNLSCFVGWIERKRLSLHGWLDAPVEGMVTFL